jgi:murein DD-endopeptidase MepM/ murein hydrolase activator NlpD
MPVEGRTSSSFGKRLHPVDKVWKDHKGEDIAASTGTPVSATADGTVTQAWRAGSFGNLVEIDHGGGYKTRYAHLSSIAVRFGQEVTRGETIGAVGMTGTATAPHLHYEILVRGEQVNPAPFL